MTKLPLLACAFIMSTILSPIGAIDVNIRSIGYLQFERLGEKRDELTYGGIKFGHSLMQDSRPIVWYMTVSNRDAVTARGIAVGDSLKKVMDIYGRPDFIDFNNRWFYGYLRYNSDNIVGIFFEHNGSKVTKIIISDN